MLVIEQRALEAVCSLATTLEREVPKIADRLDRIAVALESCSKNHAPPDIIQSAMGPGDDDDVPF